MNEEYEFKVGDVVITKPGFTNKQQDDTQIYGGAGYTENLKFEIESVSSSAIDRNRVIAWPTKSGLGIYFYALDLYTTEPTYEIY